MNGLEQVRITKETCFHCGDSCGPDPYVLDEHPFCCTGCQTVYQILSENGMDQFYQLQAQAGTRVQSKVDSDLSHLDDPKLRAELVDFSDGVKTRIRFRVPAIHCSSCVWLLENLHRLDDAIVSVQVSFGRQEATVIFDEHKRKLSEIVALLHRIGYPPSLSAASRNDADRTVEKNIRLVHRIAVAGFCFGNIMLLSFPEYLDLTNSISTEFKQFFGLVNLILALPVLLFSGWPYLSSAWKGLKHRHLNIDLPISLGMLTLMFWSCWLVMVQGEAGYFDSLAGLVFFLLLGRWFQEKTYTKLSFDRDYRSFFPLAARTSRNGTIQNLPLTELRIGDVVLARNEELLVADGILISQDAALDYAFVTGESLPLRVQEDAKVFAGAKVCGKEVAYKIQSLPDRSYLTDLWNDPIFNKSRQAGLSSFIDRVSKYFTLSVLLIALLSAVYWFFAAGSAQAVQVFAAVLVVACPCALALAAPFTYGHAMRTLGRNKLYLRSASVVEELARIDTVVLDKTGTLTRTDRANINYKGSELGADQLSELYAICNSSTHPLNLLLSAHLKDVCTKGAIPEIHEFEETSGKGIRAKLRGRSYLIGSSDFLEEAGVQFSSQDGLGSRILVSIDGVYIGCFHFRNQYRERVLRKFSALNRIMKMLILSGDSEGERRFLTQALGEDVSMRFKQSPQDKLEQIRMLQPERKVLMIGDGVNDAGALKQADVGIAVSEDTTRFSPASDAILDANELARVPDQLRFCRSALRILKHGLLLSIAYNLVGLAFAVSGMLSPLIAAILMPLSSISMVGFTTLMVALAAKKNDL